MTSTIDQRAVTQPASPADPQNDLPNLANPPEPADPPYRGDLPSQTGRAVVRQLIDFEPGVCPPVNLDSPGVCSPAGPPPVASTSTDNTVRAHAHLVLRLVMEVLDGRRPAAQLVGVLSEPARRYVIAASGQLDEPHQRPGRDLRRRAAVRHYSGGQAAHTVAGLRSMRVCQPAAGVAEISAVWRYRGRSRALAARFELRAAKRSGPSDQTRWWCTELRLG